MSLAQLFYAKNHATQCRQLQKSRSRRHVALRRPRKLLFEPLEPRLLLSADPTILPALAPDPTLSPDPPAPLAVSALESTPSGFSAQFNQPVDSSVLNLYDTEGGGFGLADVTLEGETTGPVRGSLVVDPDSEAITFIRTGGPLPADTYTLTLRSAANAFKDMTGGLLDGNAYGTAGDDYVTTFTVNPSDARVVSVPDFARGPGQPVNVPTTGTGIPIRLSGGAGVTKVDLAIQYNPALLTISAATLGAALPPGSVLQADLTVPGVVTLGVTSLTPLGAGPLDLATLTSQIPHTAPYGSTQILDITQVSLNQGALPALGDDGLHQVAYFGDTTGDRQYSPLDAELVLRVDVGLDSGFGAYRLIDPLVLADTTGNGTVSALDASRLLQEVQGGDLDRPEIPPIVPVIIAALANDTGARATDGLTKDPAIAGTARDDGTIASLRAGFDAILPGGFFDVFADLQPDGRFVFDRARLEQINGGALADGSHTLHLQAIDNQGNASFFDVFFTLDRLAPAVPTFHLAPAFDTDPAGDQQTTLDVVTLAGQTDPNTAVALLQTSQTGTSENTGAFNFPGVPLTEGANPFTVRATDLAGNHSEFSRAITRLPAGPQDTAPPVILAALNNDTGASPTDHITQDPSIAGNVTDAGPLAAFGARVDGTPQDSFFDVFADLGPDGIFSFPGARVEQINGGTLADGPHTLRLRATDQGGNPSFFNVLFTLDTTPPPLLAFGLALTSDTGAVGDGQTGAARVTLVGRTDPDVAALLAPGAAASSNGAGTFQMPGIALTLGDNAFTLLATDLAGNTATFARTITRVAAAADADVVLAWNQILLDAVRLDASPPPLASRNMAIVHAAVYDVINALDGTPGYYVTRSAESGTSAVAAVAAAAHRTLSALYPAQRATLDTALATSLAGEADGGGKEAGIALGRAVSDDLLALRADDGWNDIVQYFTGTEPGDWRPTPPMFDPALLPQWATMEPFAMTSPSQFRPDGPPPLTSQAYTDAFNEVKTLGEATGSSRTPEQTQIARFWADGLGTYTPAGHWNQIAAEVALAESNSLSENARLFAQLNIALADAAIVSWDAKYQYGFWRPATAIAEADLDGNAQTVPDPDWLPLLITPAFPEYTSGHSTYSGAAEAILTAAFGAQLSFTTTSFGLPGVQRTFASFHDAAEEAGFSRVLGGIHFRFSSEDGLASGRALGEYVLRRFSVATDEQAPRIIIETPQPEVVSAHTVVLNGRVLDTLSGVASLQAQIDIATFADVPIDAEGHFTFSANLPLDGSADGRHRITLQAVDRRGNTTEPLGFDFTLDTRPPTLSVDSPLADAVLQAGDRLQGIANPTGSTLTELRYAFNGSPSMPIAFDAAGAFDQALDLSDLTIGDHTLRITARDAAGNTASTTLSATLPGLIPFTITGHTPEEGAGDVGVTYRPQVSFSRAVDPATLSASNFYATGPTGAKLPATIVPADDGSFAWLFFRDPLPGGATVTVHLDGSTIRAQRSGQFLDADGDGVAGGALAFHFTTVSLVPLAGTSLSGRVVDPGPDLAPMTFDDIRSGSDGILHTDDDVFLNPIAGARVFILGLEDQAVLSDALGRFHFDAVPVGDVKVVIDGRTATNAPAGFYWPEMVMDARMQLGQPNTLMGTMGTLEEGAANATREEVYLPRLRTSIFNSVSGTGPTMVTLGAEAAPGLTDEQRRLLTIEVQPGSLIGAHGERLAAGQVGISLVPPELVRDMLPPGVLQHTFDITVQAPGIDRFATPAPMTFPNVFNAPPGTQLNFLSFDHTTGRLVIEGTATVSADGKFATTDPGTGITHPGWHGLPPPGSASNSCDPPPNPVVQRDAVGLADGVRDYLFKDDNHGFLLSFGNNAPLIDPNDKDPCSPRNRQATPMVVKISLNDGRANEFLSGLRSWTFKLLPGQTADINVKTLPLSRNVRIPADRLYGVKVTIQAFQQDTFGQLRPIPLQQNDASGNLIPLQTREIYIYRYLDAVDLSGDGRIEFPDTIADGPGKAARTRPLEIRANADATPTLRIANNPDFRVSPSEFVFDPQTALPAMQALQVFAKDGTEVAEGKLTLEGKGVERQEWFIDRTEFLKTLEALFTGAQGGASPAEKLLINTPSRREAIADESIARARTLLALFDAGLTRVTRATASSVKIDVFQLDKTRAQTVGNVSLGDSFLVDNEANGGVRGLVYNRPQTSVAKQNFWLSKVLNEDPKGMIDVYLNHFFSLQDVDAIGVNALIDQLAYNFAHEIGHTVGLTHTMTDVGKINLPGDEKDVMAQRLALSPPHLFGLTANAFRVAVNLDWTSAQAQQAIDYFAAWVRADNRFGNFNAAKDFAANGGGSNPGGKVGASSAINRGILYVVTDPELGFAVDLDLGTVSVDGAGGHLASQKLLAINVGDRNLMLKDFHVASGGSSDIHVTPLFPAGTVLIPGATAPFSVTFDPTTSGDHTAKLVIANDGTVPEYELNITGFGLSPAGDIRLDVPNNNVGGLALSAMPRTHEDFATLRNIGASPLSVFDIRLGPGPGSGQFAVGGLPAGFGPGNPLVLAPGDSLAFDVVFDPNRIGPQPGVIEILSDDPETPSFLVHVVGTGLADIGTALQYGNEFVALETPGLTGSPIFRQVSNARGHWSFFLPPEQPYHAAIFDPASGLIGHLFGVTAPSGTDTQMGAPVFLASTAPDSDGDGLPDDIEFAIGTAQTRGDTDRDGLSDFAEIAQGLDPLSGLVIPTGVVAAVTLQGTAQEVVVEGSLTDAAGRAAYVATGSHGLAVVDVSQFGRPLVLSELNLAGSNGDVSVDVQRGLAVVAGGPAGVHIVDVSDPVLPRRVDTVALLGGANHVEVFDGIAYVTSGADLVSVDLTTREVRQALDLGDVAITDLAREGATLYTLDASRTLRAVTLAGLEMRVRGSLTLDDAASRLFVGDGIAHVARPTVAGVTSRGGYSTVDVFNPDSLVLISGPDVPAGSRAPGTEFVTNGAGLGVLIGSDSGQHVLDVMSVADPNNTYAFVSRVDLPAAPTSVALAAGFAFVTDATGLRVVNFVPLDVAGVPPAVTLTAQVADEDLAAPGIQILEGRRFEVTAELRDDAQVRNVELLVNNRVVRNDVSFPWELFVTVPAVQDQGPTLAVRGRATDTGGNVTLSAPLVFGVLRDTTPPTILQATPTDGAQLFFVPDITLRFDEGIDDTLLNPTGVTLTDLGPDRQFGTVDDVTVATSSLILRDAGRVLSIVPDRGITAGDYRLVISPSIIADRAGNHLGAPFMLHFTARGSSELRALSGFPANPALPSANAGQEIGIGVPWAPELARATFQLDFGSTRSPLTVAPTRVDGERRIAYFQVHPLAGSADINVFAGATRKFTGFSNWNVTDGFVDLFGPDVIASSFSQLDPLPGNGLYVNLDGNLLGSSQSQNAGRLESKVVFDLLPGNYLLQFDLAGSQSFENKFNDPNTVTVSLGGAFTEIFAPARTAPFTQTTRTITVTTPESARLVFDHAGGDGVGLLLDDVQLTRIDSGQVLLNDAFDLVFPDNPIFLQIVPVVHGADVTAVSGFNNVRLIGGGFIDGQNTQYRFGDVVLTDTTTFSGPNVGADHAEASLTLPISEAAFGAITVTTAGGTSDPFTPDLPAITGAALSGTPADPRLLSANPGQALMLTGTGLTPTTDLLWQYIDPNGTNALVVVNPIWTNVAGTEAALVVPSVANGVSTVRILGSQARAPIQIVPVLGSIEVAATHVELLGRGFVENDSVYSFTDRSVTDLPLSDTANVGWMGPLDNAAVLLSPAPSGTRFAAVRVTTPGGTSAPFPGSVVFAAPLGFESVAVAVNPSASEVLLATPTEIHRFDRETGAVHGSFAIPGSGPATSLGLQILPAPIASLGGTPVPAGSLLVTNGSASPDRIFALDATSGAQLASLDLGQDIDPVGGVFHPGSGHLFLLDGSPDEIVEVDPATGAVLNRAAAPFDVGDGDLALDSATGRLWVTSSQSTDAAEIFTTGTVVRRLRIAPLGVSPFAAAGLAFDGVGRMLVASVEGVLYEVNQAPAPTLSSIGSFAADGTPASPEFASANAGQVIELIGTNLRLNDLQVQFPTQGLGDPVFGIAPGDSVQAVAPLAVNAEGTRAQVQVAMRAATGPVQVASVGGYNLGFSSFKDAIYRDVTIQFTPTSSSAHIQFVDSGPDPDGIAKESWGLDNVRVARMAAPEMPVFQDDFEDGADAAWSLSSTDNTRPQVFTRFSGRFHNKLQALNLTGLTPGEEYRATFDLYVLDLWALRSFTSGPTTYVGISWLDFFNVLADGREVFHESFSNLATVQQTFAATGSAPLQIVPTISGLSGRPGTFDQVDILGSGFMDGASTITVGGLAIQDRYPAAGFRLGGDPDAQAWSDRYRLLGVPLAVEGPIRVTTAGGFAEHPGPSFTPPVFVEFRGIQALAAEGAPANPVLPSANTGQLITLVGLGFTRDTLVQFSATDTTGFNGPLTRKGAEVSADGRNLTIEVPALARTGLVRVVGDDAAFPLQVVPTLRAAGGAIATGNTVLLEGTGLTQGALTLGIDGQLVTDQGLRTLGDVSSESDDHTANALRTGLDRTTDQQLVTLTVPGGVSSGVITATTEGGTATWRPSGTSITGIDLLPNQPLRGTPTLPGIATANAGQSIQLTGVGLRGDDQVVFRMTSVDFAAREQAVRPFSVAADGTSLGVRVPNNAVTGMVRLAREGSGRLLQIVPTLGGVLLEPGGVGGASTYHGGILRLSGTGFDSANTTIHIGAEALPGQPGVVGAFLRVSALVPDGAPFGAFRVSTVGGISTPVSVVFDAIAATAATGTPADPTLPSANPGQTITLKGQVFGVTPQVAFRSTDGEGAIFEQLQPATLIFVDPLTLAMELTVQVPEFYSTTGALGVVADQRNFQPHLQIVPVVHGFRVVSVAADGKSAQVVLHGRGFVEDQYSVYRFGTTEVVDGGYSGDPNVGVADPRISGGTANNAVVLMTVPLTNGILGPASVTTPGGASAVARMDAVLPNRGALRGVAFNPVNGELLAATATQIHRIDPTTGTVLGSFAIPGGGSVTSRLGLGLQILPAAIPSLGGTPVPAGSLLVTRGDASPDRIFAVDPVTGSQLAVLNLGLDLDPQTAGVFHPASGHLFVVQNGSTPLDSSTGRAKRLVELDPATGVEITRLPIPPTTGTFEPFAFLLGLALDPQSGDLWVGLGEVEVVKMTPTGTELGRVNLQDFGLAGGGIGKTGMAFDAQGRLVLSAISDRLIRFPGDPPPPGALYRLNLVKNLIDPGLGAPLTDVAFDGSTVWVASPTTRDIHRIDPVTRAQLGRIPIPGGGSTSLGLQILPAGLTLHDSASDTGVPVPAGSLLVTNGGLTPDRIFAVNASTGQVLANLTLSENLDATAGVFHAATGALFVLDPNADQVVRIDPATGAVVSRFGAFIDIEAGGLAVDPVTDNLWIGSNRDNRVVELTLLGDVVQTVNLAAEGIGTEITGLAVDAAKRAALSTDFLMASSTRGVIHFNLDPPVVGMGDAPVTTVLGPRVSLPTTLMGTPGTTVTVPVLIDDAVGLEAADLQIAYDTALLDVRPGGVRKGALTSDGLLVANVDDVAGLITVGLAMTRPRGEGGGRLLEIDFQINPSAAPGATPLILRRVSFNEDRLIVTQKDGEITVFKFGEIHGLKFEDLDGDGVRDAGDPALAGWTIFLDGNENGRLDIGEANTTTDATGAYVFPDLLPGHYLVAEQFQPGWDRTLPADPTAPGYPVDITIHGDIVTRDFGNFRLGAIRGVKFDDLDGNGVRDAGEPGLPGWTIYLDSNGSSTLDGKEVSTTTEGTGAYAFTGLGPSTYRVGEVVRPGWAQTTPAMGYHEVIMTSGLAGTGRDFGNRNLPPVANDDTYNLNEDCTLIVPGPGALPTLLANDGNIIPPELVTLTLISGPANGTVTELGNDGNFSYMPNLNFNGTDSFVYQVTDDHNQSSQATVLLTIQSVNDPPEAEAGRDQTAEEGGPVSFDAGASFDVDGDWLTFRWDFGDDSRGNGVTPTHAYGDNGVFTVTLTVEDGFGGESTDTLEVTVNNVAPVVDPIAGPTTGVRGQPLSFAGRFTDPGADTWTATVDYGDGAGPQALTLNLDKTFALSHVYADNGSYAVTLTVTDDDGGVGAVQQQVEIKAVDLQADPCDPGKTALVVGGTLEADTIRFNPGGASGAIKVLINGVLYGAFTPTGRIVAHGQAGNDDIDAAGSIGLMTEFYGDAGNDRLKGGAGAALLLGGDGDDQLIGGRAGDVLIGGAGKDRLVGGPGDDLLIGGATQYDDDHEALCAILKEWTRTELGYAQRVANLRNGGGRNGGYTLDEGTVYGDSAEDTLTGSSGQDWFFADGQDQVTDRHRAKLVTPTPLAPGPDPAPDRRGQGAPPLIDWSGEFAGSTPVSSGAYGNEAGKSQGSWVKNFLLELAAEDLGPNAGLQVVLPPTPEPLALVGGKGRK